MTSFRAFTLSGLLLCALLEFACGKTTPLGRVRPDQDGSGGTTGASSPGGAAGNSGASGDGGASGGSAAGGTSSGAGTAGAAGIAGTASGGASGAGTAGTSAIDAGLSCHLPKPAPIPNPTPEDLERAGLIHDYCAALARDNCWDRGGSSQIGSQTQGCSVEERITACEQDILYEFRRDILPACDGAWQAAIKCMAAATHIPCQGAGLGDWPTRSCSAEKTALSECTGKSHPTQTVSGLRTTCSYGAGRHTPCAVSCQSDSDYFTMDCSGPAGLPLVCFCAANFRTNLPRWDPTELYASDCREAAQVAADGAWCTNSLDCCIEWEGFGIKACACGSDDGRCEARAQERQGIIVPICPQHVP
jgi:hypothetical protein